MEDTRVEYMVVVEVFIKAENEGDARDKVLELLNQSEDEPEVYVLESEQFIGE